MLNQGMVPQRGQLARLDQGGDPNIFPLLKGQQWPSKTPVWSTTELRSKSGRIFRKQNYSYPIWRFSAKYSVLSQKHTRLELSKLFIFFNSRAGQFGDFLYYDPSDYSESNQFFARGDGVTTIFQLRRELRQGTTPWSEPVFAVSGTPVITADGVEVGFQLLEHGKVQFDTAPAAGALLRWSGTFLFWCHFTNDELTVDQMNLLLWSSDGLSFETLRP